MSQILILPLKMHRRISYCNITQNIVKQRFTTFYNVIIKGTAMVFKGILNECPAALSFCAIFFNPNNTILNMFTLDEILSKLRVIEKMGFVKTHRSGDT